jgi:hypothetical protein
MLFWARGNPTFFHFKKLIFKKIVSAYYTRASMWGGFTLLIWATLELLSNWGTPASTTMFEAPQRPLPCRAASVMVCHRLPLVFLFLLSLYSLFNFMMAIKNNIYLSPPYLMSWWPLKTIFWFVLFYDILDLILNVLISKFDS